MQLRDPRVVRNQRLEDPTSDWFNTPYCELAMTDEAQSFLHDACEVERPKVVHLEYGLELRARIAESRLLRVIADDQKSIPGRTALLPR